MNSITRHISPATIIALLRQVRSARTNIVLVVEGEDDIALFSQSLGLTRDCIISCFGKGRLMEVFSMIPNKYIDAGMIFLRDSDFDAISHSKVENVCLFVSDRYDFEMVIVEGRIFERIFVEYMKGRGSRELAKIAFKKIVEAAAWIGALRKYSLEKKISLDFDDIKYGFVDSKTLEIDVREMIRYLFAHSRKKLSNLEEINNALERIVKNAPAIKLCCSKEFFAIFSIALCRYYKTCDYSDCAPELLAKIVRIASIIDDIRRMSLYPVFKDHVERITEDRYVWSGDAL